MSTLVYTKLMEARLTLQNTALTKSGHNKFAGYKYFELGDFIPAIQKIFKPWIVWRYQLYGRHCYAVHYRHGR